MKPDELETKIQDLVDGNVSQDDYDLISTEIKSKPKAMKLYLAYVDLANMVALDAAEQAQFTPVISIDQVVTRQKRRTMKVALLSAAAILVIGLITMRLFFVDPETPPSLAFQTSPGSLFTITHDGAEDQPNGQTMQPGSRLQLSQGALELTFASGVKSIITAPADLTLHADDRLYLAEGTGWFHVPKGAEGFQVKTRDLNIVDLGTEFGVLAKTNDHDEVHVLKGKVQVTALRVRKESATLTAGQASRIDPIGRLSPIPSANNQFANELPQSLPYMHWSFDQVQSSGFPSLGNHPQSHLGHAKPVSKDAATMQCDGPFGSAARFTEHASDSLVTSWPGVSGNKVRTVACWVKLDAKALRHGGSSLIAWGVNQPGKQGHYTKWKFAIDRMGRPVVVGYNGGFYADSINIANSKWHHVACVHSMDDNNTPRVELYLNGKKQNVVWASDHNRPLTTPNTVTDSHLSYSARIGTTLGFQPPQNGPVMLGAIDELYLIEGVLEAPEIKNLMENNQYPQ
ncbi:FecR domain-containing protein [Verrucomicrobiaceae bacterium N1E253]|uniref:FecR domain-containing protein n=1 Tax=Oceaniferula marina TaxID=2748318 RepID=A0A851GC94_9BACT|nr:LamG-like jellyroll fold domain-containing protein [Oceaniferula marina]NWK55046.1 FecR domain-containing protein [Oceaniferula marina]